MYLSRKNTFFLGLLSSLVTTENTEVRGTQDDPFPTNFLHGKDMQVVHWSDQYVPRTLTRACSPVWETVEVIRESFWVDQSILFSLTLPKRAYLYAHCSLFFHRSIYYKRNKHLQNLVDSNVLAKPIEIEIQTQMKMSPLLKAHAKLTKWKRESYGSGVL